MLYLTCCSVCAITTVKVSRTPLIVKGSKPKTILGVAPTREHVDEALSRRKRKNDGAAKGENEGEYYLKPVYTISAGFTASPGTIPVERNNAHRP